MAEAPDIPPLNALLRDFEIIELESPFDDYYTSNSQAFYFIESATGYGSEPLVAGEDWICIFSGDICVGARRWNGPNTDVPANGDVSDIEGMPDFTEGYLQVGDLPTFKV